MRYFLFSEPHWLHNEIIVVMKTKTSFQKVGWFYYEQYEYVNFLIRLNYQLKYYYIG